MDQGIAIVIGAVIGAAVSGIIAYFTSRSNLKAVERTANSTIEYQSKALIVDLERTGQEIKAKIGIEVLSKNRQEWINDLRKQIASFVSQANSSIVDIPKKHALIKGEILKKHGKRDDENFQLDSDGLKEFMSFTQDIILNLSCLMINLELMLNPNEEKNKQVINLMADIYLSVSDLFCCFLPSYLLPEKFDKNLTPKEICISIQNHSKELKEKVLEILKTEWERVKKGI